MALLTDGLWSEGVYMELGKLGEFRVVGSTREAVNILIYRWPVKVGDAYRYAVSTCYAVLDGELPADDARQAFILAVEESGKFITAKVPRNLVLVTPTDPSRKSTDMKFWLQKRARR
ncbi:DUF982 domain-containing protein [Rhizobium tubonense]|uniref:DUF982 domain-containing protein n=1 Tax=Rhizobium tubonense TaxID=484088 RepID=A0A2W4C829_9HYPH|nr:DUF982 domain-containing protein [Rhizobium tubonense]PZM07568.1 hypothetical protein CPY51_31040 [Rhizobium tubonense]